jgi:nicotinate-nucleotide adenylyltransferase
LKIGLFGGTFNPVHNGHLINAQIIKDQTRLDKILFIPSKHPVHKAPDGLASAEDRFNMIKLAVKDNSDFEASRIEIDREADSYFIITYKQLLHDYPEDNLYIILGADAFLDVFKWKDYNELLKSARFILIRRPGYNISPVKDSRIREIIIIDNPLIEISSSQIRENIRNKVSVRNLIPPEVERYISEKRLYSD